MKERHRPKQELISVVMPVFNGAKHLRLAIESILNQTYRHFEFLILDDASEDESVAIIESYRDERIQLIRATKNEGIVTRLNEGIKLANGKYIARMDADDVAIAHRLEKQIKFLQARPEIILVGSNAYFIDDQNIQQQKPTNVPLSPEAIKARLLIKTAFLHPTIMMRTEVIKKFYYDRQFQFIEDYELWTRIQKLPIANLAEPLLYYRFHASNTHSVKEEQVKNLYPILAERQLAHYNISYSPEEFKIHCLLGETGKFKKEMTAIPIAAVAAYLDRLINWNTQTSVFEQNAFKEEILNIWKEFSLAMSNTLTGIQFLKLFFHQKTWHSTNTWNKIQLCYNFMLQYPMVFHIYRYTRKRILKKPFDHE